MDHLSEKPLSEAQLRQASTHIENERLQALGILGVPLAVATAAIGNVPLAIGLGAFSAITISLTALRNRIARKQRIAAGQYNS